MRGSLRVLGIVVAVGLGLLLVLRSDDVDELEFRGPPGPGVVVDTGEAGPSPGDRTVLAGELLDDDGEPAGRLDGVCTLTSVPDEAAERRQRCALTLTVGTEDGETELQLAGVGRVEAGDVRYTVVGGSGEFADASGDALIDYAAGEHPAITVSVDD